MFVGLGKAQQVLVPDLQSTITSHDKPLIAVRLTSGDHGVVLRWTCENLHLDVTAQIQRIKRTKCDERRAEILEYQRNAVDALYRWAQSIRIKGRAGLIESEPIEKPATPDKDASLPQWQHYYEQMAAFTA